MRSDSKSLRVVPPRVPARRVRQRRGLRTEQAILEATLRSVAARGIHETSLEQVAAEVGVAKSSILWHFGSKEGLLLRVAEHAFAAVQQGSAREILSLPTFEQRAEAIWRMYVDALENRPALRRVILYLIFAGTDARPDLRARLQQLYKSMRELFAAALAEVVDDGGTRQRLAALGIAAMDGLFLQWLLDPEALHLDAIRADLRRISLTPPADTEPERLTLQARR